MNILVCSQVLRGLSTAVSAGDLASLSTLPHAFRSKESGQILQRGETALFV